jgi:hypothetical protein
MSNLHIHERIFRVPPGMKYLIRRFSTMLVSRGPTRSWCLIGPVETLTTFSMLDLPKIPVNPAQKLRDIARQVRYIAHSKLSNFCVIYSVQARGTVQGSSLFVCCIPVNTIFDLERHSFHTRLAIPEYSTFKTQRKQYFHKKRPRKKCILSLELNLVTNNSCHMN